MTLLTGQIVKAGHFLQPMAKAMGHSVMSVLLHAAGQQWERAPPQSALMDGKESRALGRATAGDPLVPRQHHGEDHQQVQQPAGSERGRKANDPKNQKYESNGVEHDELQWVVAECALITMANPRT